jgi:hypothetical protein
MPAVTDLHNPRGVIPRHVRRSAAWRSLSENARKVLIALGGKYNGRNNGRLAFGGEDGLAIGLSLRDTEAALFELELVGLVDSRPQGPIQ